MSGKAPSEATLKRVERELRKLPRGAQRAVGGGIYLRLDGDGRRRFQFRTRVGKGQPGGTYDSWEDAVVTRSEWERLAESGAAEGLETFVSMRRMTWTDYARKHWWPEHVLLHLDPVTQSDYQQYLVDAVELVGSYTLEQIISIPNFVGTVKVELKKMKTFPATHKRRPGEFASAAADHVLQVISAVTSYAVKNGIIDRNPFLGVERFHTTRGLNGKKNGGHRRIHPAEVKHPRVIAKAGLGFRGSIAEIEGSRAAIELITYGGFRPEDVCAMRHFWWRNEDGPIEYLRIPEALKDIRGHKLLGEPKTGKRRPMLWPALGEQLERVYQAQGCPGLDALVRPDSIGGYLDWGNWRQGQWYRALHRAGISNGAKPKSDGAFEPYLSRHVGICAMLHAIRPPELGGGAYSRDEVARQYGHTVDTLNKVYADIPADLHGIAGLTVDQIIRRARREAWGPIPGDPDYEEILYTTTEAAKLTGISVNALCGRIKRGSLPAQRMNWRQLVSDHHLVLLGLLTPRHLR